MIEERETQVSQRVSQNVRALRQHNRWTMARLSAELGTLGFKMSAAVINTLENGVSAQHGIGRHAHSVTCR